MNGHIAARPRAASSAISLARAGLALIALTLPALAQLNIGVEGGLAHGFGQKAIAGPPWSGWTSSPAYGASLEYRFRRGLTLGLRVSETKLKANSGGTAIGTLKLRPWIAILGYQKKPESRGFGWHCRMGGGVALPKFDNGPAVNAITQATLNTVTTSRAPWMEFSGGLDYFLGRWVSVTFDYRSLTGNVPLRWQTSSNGRAFTDWSYVLPGDPDRFYPSNGQVLGGLRFWLK